MSMDLVEFVSKTELHHKPLDESLASTVSKRASATDDKQEGCVVAGAIQAFTANVSGQVKQDILNATLFAQLAANKHVDREENPVEWYKQYKNILEKIGFVVQQFEFNKYNSESQTFSMDKAVLDILKAGMSKSGKQVAEKAIDALGKLPGDDYSVRLFDNQSSSMNQGNFQIGACEQAQNGDVILGCGAFYFTAIQHMTRFLWWRWNSSHISMYQGYQTMVFNQGVYSQVRHTIANKLGTKVSTFVASIDL